MQTEGYRLLSICRHGGDYSNENKRKNYRIELRQGKRKSEKTLQAAVLSESRFILLCFPNMNCNSCQMPMHALVFPYPTQGHINPMMQFSKRIASKGLIVTFVTTYHRHAQINESHANSEDHVLAEARSLGLDIRSANISDGLPLDFDRSGNFYDFMRSVDNMGEELEELINNLNKKGPPISCVIADSLLYWSLDVTRKFGIPWISFWTQPTIVYSLYYNIQLLMSKGHFPSKGPDQWQDWIDYVPGVPKMRPTDLPSFLQATDMSDYVLDLLIRSYESVRRADWVLGNSFDELESEAVEAMRLEAPILLVGPLLPSGYLSISDACCDLKVGTSLFTEPDCSEWLNTKARHSVIYISFGSLVHVSKPQLEEIAMGLIESQQPFLWVLRYDIVASNVSAYLPEGFLHETRSQGLVVPWCSQLEVLSHPSVGGFFTHCGWNSVLEGMTLGVPMLGFPLWADQYTNCKLLADEWKIGLKLRNGGEEKLIHRCDVLRAIKKLMNEEEGKEMRKRTEKLRDIARKAAAKGGSSDHNIENFLHGLKLKHVEAQKNRY